MVKFYGFEDIVFTEMIKNGVLIPWIALSYSHGEDELKLTKQALENTFKIYKKAVKEGFNKYLDGNVIKPVFRKYN